MKKLILFLVVLNLITFGQTAEDYFTRGLAKYDLEYYKGAVEDFNKAIQLNPDEAVAYNNRGNAKYFLKDMIGACKDWSKAGELGYSDAFILIKEYCK